MKIFSQDRVVEIVGTLILIFLAIVFLYPLYFVFIASFSDPTAVSLGEVLFMPKDINLIGYQKLFSNNDIIRGAGNTIFYTIIATTLNVFLTMMSAYALSINFPGKKLIGKLIIFTMFFNGGMIPNYLLMKDLGLLNTRWAMILPGLVSVYNLIVARNFIESNIPHEMHEAAEIDGCDHFRFFFSIVWPLSRSIIAILVLFYASGHWNSYMNAVLYIQDRNLFPLQLILREILVLNQVSSSAIMGISDMESMNALQKIADSMKYALIIVTTIPMMIVYPFVQKHFVKGVMIGSVKG